MDIDREWLTESGEWILPAADWEPEGERGSTRESLTSATGTLAAIMECLLRPDEDDDLLNLMAYAHAWAQVLNDSMDDADLLAPIDELEIGGRHYSDSIEATLRTWDWIFSNLVSVSSELPEVLGDLELSAFSWMTKMRVHGRESLSRRIVENLPAVRARLIQILPGFELPRLCARVAADCRKIRAAAESSRSEEQKDRVEHRQKDPLEQRLAERNLKGTLKLKLARALLGADGPLKLVDLFECSGSKVPGGHREAAYGTGGSLKNPKGGLLGAGLAHVTKDGRLIATEELRRLV